jgi:hypothetical protein
MAGKQEERQQDGQQQRQLDAVVLEGVCVDVGGSSVW